MNFFVCATCNRAVEINGIEETWVLIEKSALDFCWENHRIDKWKFTKELF